VRGAVDRAVYEACRAMSAERVAGAGPTAPKGEGQLSMSSGIKLRNVGVKAQNSGGAVLPISSVTTPPIPPWATNFVYKRARHQHRKRCDVLRSPTVVVGLPEKSEPGSEVIPKKFCYILPPSRHRIQGPG